MGNKLPNKTKILLDKFSLLNIETKLKGIANKEAKNVTDIKTFKIDSIFSFEDIANIYKDIGIIVIEVNAVKNEILVNTFKFFLFKKIPPFAVRVGTHREP
ncbi:sodium:proton antiporter [Bacillus tropicus]|nr:sodium:proton antiporter [Bacillus tropicus]